MASATPTKAVQTLLADNTLVTASRSVSSLTQAAGVASAACTTHGLAIGNFTIIGGTNEFLYRGPQEVTASADANNFQFAVDSGAPATATGTIISNEIGNEPQAIELEGFGARIEVAVKNGSTGPTNRAIIRIETSDDGVQWTKHLEYELDNTANVVDEQVFEVGPGVTHLRAYVYGNSAQDVTVLWLRAIELTQIDIA